MVANSYIPEQAWNDDLEFYEACQGNNISFCTTGNGTGTAITSEATAQNAIGISSTGGGPSNCAEQDANFTTCVAGFPKPSWQTVTLSGQPSVRYSPDVSFLATPNFPGYIFCTQLTELGFPPGTVGSACDPGGATGISNALGQMQNNIPTPPIIGGTSASAPIFAGIVTLLNQFLSSKGQGNINPKLYSLAASSSNGAFNRINAGDNNVYCQAGMPTGMPTSIQCPAAGVFGFSTSTSDAATGYNLVTGLGSVDANNLAVAWAASLGETFSLTSSLGTNASLAVTQGQTSGAVNLTVSSSSTPSFITGSQTALPLTYTCAGLPSESTCNFLPSSTTAALSVSLTITTTAPTGKLIRPLDRGPSIFYALLFPGLLGIVVTLGTRKRSLNAMRILALIALLSVSALWMASCGGSSSSSKNPGTPTGSYPITVTATTGGASPLTSSVKLTLNVQ